MTQQQTPAADSVSNANSAEAVLPSVPPTWPGARGVYKYSRQAVKLNTATIIQIFILSVLTSALIQMLLDKDWGDSISGIIGVYFDVAFIVTWLTGVRQKHISAVDALKRAAQPMLVLKLLLQGVVSALLLALSLIALIIPFFFVFPRLALAGYFVVDKRQGPIEAIKSSWDVTRGHASKVWGITLINIAIVLLAITLIGAPFAIYFFLMYSAATAILYEYLTKT